MKFLFLFIPFLCSISSQFALAFSTEEMEMVFSKFLYIPSNSYEKDDVVIISQDDGALWTALQSVPAGNAPSSNSEVYKPGEDYATGARVMISDENETYTALKFVPAGNSPSSDSEFWVKYWGNANTSSNQLANTDEFSQAMEDFLTNESYSEEKTKQLADSAKAVIAGLPPVDAGINGDLNSDGIPDIIWQNSGTNETKFWFMNTDGTKKSELDLSHGAGSKWRLSATGDMDNDGNIDLLWQEENGATVFCYYMDGSGGIREGASLASGVASGWRFVSASDYNGDGNPDLLWHSTTKGSTVCWHFNGQGKVSAFSPLGSGITSVFNSYAGHDMNSDGDADVIYQNANNGKVVVWYFNDSKKVIGTKTYFSSLDASLKVVGAKDFDNDGGVDILLQNQATGVAKIVYFDKDGTQLSEKEIGTVGSTWEIRN